MKRVLASLLFLATAVQAAVPAPQNSAATRKWSCRPTLGGRTAECSESGIPSSSQPERLVSVAQSPYDFRFHIEHGEWDQVDATLRRIPTNYQFDAYKGNTPLMMVIDLFAQKAVDKPKSIWQTAVGGTVKACSGAALVVIGLALIGKPKNYADAFSKKPVPAYDWRAAAQEDAQDMPDEAAGKSEADDKAGAAVRPPRVPNPYQDKTADIAAQEKLNAATGRAEKAAKIRAHSDEKHNLGRLDYAKWVANELRGFSNEVYHNDAQPILHKLEAEIARLANQANATVASGQEFVEDLRGATHRAEQLLERLRAEGERAIHKTQKRADHTFQQLGKDGHRLGIHAHHHMDAAAQRVGEVGGALYVVGKGITGTGVIATGIWLGIKGWNKIKSLIGLSQRTQELNKFRSLITELLHRKDVNLGVQNSDGETVLQMVRRYMAANMDDRESYQLLSEVEQLIMIRSA